MININHWKLSSFKANIDAEKSHQMYINHFRETLRFPHFNQFNLGISHQIQPCGHKSLLSLLSRSDDYVCHGLYIYINNDLNIIHDTVRTHIYIYISDDMEKKEPCIFLRTYGQFTIQLGGNLWRIQWPQWAQIIFGIYSKSRENSIPVRFSRLSNKSAL